MARVTAGKNRNQQHFAQIPAANIPRSTFDRSHGLKGTYDSGFLYPILVDEGLPGDTFQCSVNTYVRMATLLHPIMDNQHVDIFFFAVPYRLVWENWARFMGEEDDPDGGTGNTYLIPQYDAPQINFAGSIHDHMGIPPDTADFLNWSALPGRAYALIWNEWFRDENLQDKTSFSMGDGPDLTTQTLLMRRGKRHDYFTSSLPWPTKGPAVSLPIGDSAPVVSTDVAPEFYVSGQTEDLPMLQGNVHVGGGKSVDRAWTAGAATNPMLFAAETGLETDLSSAVSASINDMRLAFQLQRLYERDARGGTRYTESIRSHFGVSSPDQRLQRPEYIGGSHFMINVNPIANTAGNPDGTEESHVGDLGAFVTGSHSGQSWSHSLTEHCIIIGLMSIRADLNYQQGLARMWSRRERFDHYFPALAHIGEQAVLSKEIYADGSVNDDDVWGYQEAWAEYRYHPSRIVSEFRSSHAQSLDTWHLAQDFETRPLLNDAFIGDNPPTDRVVAVTSEPTWLGDFYFNYKVTRPMPTYSVPGLIDHF